MSQRTVHVKKADYGLDAPGLVRNFFLIGAALLIVGLAILIYILPGSGTASTIFANLGVVMAISGLCFLFTASMMIWSSRYGKMRARDHLLEGLELRGDETLLDLGCGRGLLLLGAAKRLSRGRVLGVDIWSQEDLSNNSKSATFANAIAEGVANRIEIYDGDMRRLSIAGASIDVIVASLSIHNIYHREGRREVISEVARVIKPGGKVALMDFEHVKEYAADLREAGMQNVHISRLIFSIFPPVRIVTARK